MLLRQINEQETNWYVDWVYNFARFDQHDHSSGKGKQIPTGGIADGAITNVKVSGSAAISGSKISPDFGTSNIITGGDLRLEDTAGTKYVNISAPSTVTTSYTITLPQAVSAASDIASFDGSGNVTFQKLVNANVSSSAAIAYSKLALTGSILNADINASAAVAYSKLALTNSILNADVNASAAIAYSKLNLTGSILNADINASAAIAYSKLALTDSILNADINSSAAIAYSKLNLTGNIVNADVNASAAIAYSKLNLTGNLVNADINASAAIAGTKISPNFGAQDIVTTGSLNLPSWTIDSSDLILSTTTSGDVELNPVSTIARIMGATAGSSGIKYLIFGNESVGGTETGIRNNAGTIEYKSAAGAWTSLATATNANQELSNLNATAINVSLISDTDNTYDLGSALINWKDIYAKTLNSSTTLSLTTDSNGNISLLPNGTGTIVLGSTLVSDTDNTDDIGTSGVNFKDIHAKTLQSSTSLGLTSGTTLTLTSTTTTAINAGTSLTLTTGSNNDINISPDGTGKINLTKTSVSYREDIRVYNDSGSTLSQYKVVKLSGDYATDFIIDVDLVSATTDKALGVVVSDITNASGGDIRVRGRLGVVGFDTSGASVGDSVYCDASGDLTLSETDLEIGQVVTTASSGVIYVNIGGSGGGGSLGSEPQIELAPTPTSDETGNGIIATVTVDTNTGGIGTALYLASDGHYDMCDADSISTMPCRALALESGTGSKKVLLMGYFRADAWNWATVGGTIYVSTTTGALTQTAPSGANDIIQPVGYAVSDDEIFFNPSLVYLTGA